MADSNIHEISFGESPIEVKRRVPRINPRTRRVRSLLVFPAWVIASQTRTSHLHLANPIAAYECDGEGAEGLQQGFAYYFMFDVPLEVVQSSWKLEQTDEPHVAYQMIWNPDFDGYHEKGRIVLPRGKKGKEKERHRWDLHNYNNPGAGLKSAVRCSDDEIHEFAAREEKNISTLYMKDTGLPHGKRFPWGFMSAVVAGRRLV